MSRVTQVHYRRSARLLQLTFDDGRSGELSAELLRVLSPSAEVRGHGAGQAVLVPGKRDVAIVAINPVGHYALQLVFDDGHDSGLYTWQYLDDLVRNQGQRWSDYLAALHEAGLRRDPDEQVLRLQP